MSTHADDPLWLPEDGDLPPRPNLPVVCHLTWPEAHALELGFFCAAGLMALYLQVGPAAVMAALVTARDVRPTTPRRALVAGPDGR